MSPTPSGIVDQSDIVCSFLEFEHALAAERPANASGICASESSCQRKGQGMGPVSQADQQADFRVFAGDYASPYPAGG